MSTFEVDFEGVMIIQNVEDEDEAVQCVQRVLDAEFTDATVTKVREIKKEI